MKKPAHVFRWYPDTPEKRMCVFDESIMVKMEFEVTMGLYRKGGVSDILNIMISKQ